MKTFQDCTIFLPTLNNFPDIKDHIEGLSETLGEWGEIIVVDSFSDDGTYEYLQEKLSPLGAKFYQRERGLYQCWNYAISQVTTEYCYVSTIADIPDFTKLKAMFAKVVETDADYAISPPEMVYLDGSAADVQWPVHKVIADFNITEPVVLEPDYAEFLNVYAIQNYFIASLSGSFASNFGRTKFLQNGFSTEFSGMGDLVWFYNNIHKMRLLIYPELVSTFALHDKSYHPPTDEMRQRLEDLLHQPKLHKHTAVDTVFYQKERLYSIIHDEPYQTYKKNAVVIVGLGRSGTTSLYEAFLEHGMMEGGFIPSITHDRDLIPGYIYRTYAYPPERHTEHVKYVFLHRDPRNTVLSTHKMINEWGHAHYQQLRSDKFKPTEGILDGDSLNLENLFDAWRGCDFENVIKVKYESLFEGSSSLDAIREFTGLKVALPPLKKENVDWESSEHSDQLTQTFTSLLKKREELGNIECPKLS